MRKLKYSTAEFVERARSVHGDLYDYTKSIYEYCMKKLIITCRKHGDFLQSPFCHINKKAGCQECAGLKVPSTKEFIERARAVHGDKYDYSKSIYRNAHSGVVIICKLHGKFRQNPTHHINGKQGCPICKESKGEAFVAETLKSLGVDYIRQKTFRDCRSPATNYPLKYDFYIPNKNILIEFNGEQHYSQDRYYWRKKGKSFEELVCHDNIKREYAVKNNFTFLVLKYNDQRIKETLLSAVA